VFERAVELERQLVERSADQRLEGLLVVQIELVEVGRLIVVVVGTPAVVPLIVGGQSLAALYERLELDLGLGVVPATKANEREHDRAADDHRAESEHGYRLREPHQADAAEALEQAQQPEARDHRRCRGEQGAAQAGRGLAHPA
jgi:hypothetical protein